MSSSLELEKRVEAPEDNVRQLQAVEPFMSLRSSNVTHGGVLNKADPHRCKREKVRGNIRDPASAIGALEGARNTFKERDYLKGMDVYEQLIEIIPEESKVLLAELYDFYHQLPCGKNRYSLYVSRSFNFHVKEEEFVFDIGGSPDPFPYAKHLADFTPDEDSYDRANMRMKSIKGIPFTECNNEKIPFTDEEFDFVYCSHVLEHAVNLETACSDLMRVAKRGYRETPHIGKDFFLNTSSFSNHNWALEVFNGILCFSEYSELNKKGLQCDLLIKMNEQPQTPLEKAFPVLLWLKTDLINTAVYCEEEYTYTKRRLKPEA